MLEVEFPSEMKQYVGQKVGSSDWLTVDQKRIDDFAAVSGDHNWIHIDRERAKQQGNEKPQRAVGSRLARRVGGGSCSCFRLAHRGLRARMRATRRPHRQHAGRDLPHRRLVGAAAVPARPAGRVSGRGHGRGRPVRRRGFGAGLQPVVNLAANPSSKRCTS